MNKTNVCRVVFFALAAALVSVSFDAFADNAQVFAPAPATAQEAPSFFQSLISMLPLVGMCYLTYWWMVIRPQESGEKKRKEFVENLKRGDSVVTSGGLIGRFSGAEKDAIIIEIAPNVKVKVAQNHVVGLEKGEAKAEAA